MRDNDAEVVDKHVLCWLGTANFHSCFTICNELVVCLNVMQTDFSNVGWKTLLAIADLVSFRKIKERNGTAT